MKFWLWAVLGILILIILCLLAKLYMMRKTAREIGREFTRHLKEDTNTLMSISSRDKAMAALAETVNCQLRVLRRKRHLYEMGDLELKEAITNISHDLRTPLTAIYGYLELLRREETSEAVKSYLQQIENRSAAMKQLTEELFRYSMLSSAGEDLHSGQENAPLDIRGVLEESLISFFGVMEQRGIVPVIEMSPEPVVRAMDKAALGRIFSNIISNALKYSDGDLKVALSGEGVVTFSNRAKNMDAVAAARLFDRFYTVETARNSTGLGLSIAKLLTERMNGRISAEYKDGRLSIIVSFPEELPEK